MKERENCLKWNKGKPHCTWQPIFRISRPQIKTRRVKNRRKTKSKFLALADGGENRLVQTMMTLWLILVATMVDTLTASVPSQQIQQQAVTESKTNGMNKPANSPYQARFLAAINATGQIAHSEKEFFHNLKYDFSFQSIRQIWDNFNSIWKLKFQCCISCKLFMALEKQPTTSCMNILRGRRDFLKLTQNFSSHLID